MKKLIFIISCLGVLFLKAQQEQQYSQYLINPFTINPAIAGTEDFIDLQLGHRSQWLGLEGSPHTTYLTGHATVGKNYRQYGSRADHSNWHGVGFQAFDDRTGPLKRSAFLLAYAYNIGLTRKTRLSMGTYVGFKHIKTNASYWENINDQTDDLFSTSLSTQLQPNFQLGISIYNPQYFINISGMNLLAMQINFNENTSDTDEMPFYQRHFFANAGLHLDAGYKVRVSPAVLLKYSRSSRPSLDLSLKVDHDNNRFWYGASMRAIESFNVFAGVSLYSKLDLSYAYEYSVSQLRRVNTGTHEIIIGLRIMHPKNVICPQKFW